MPSLDVYSMQIKFDKVASRYKVATAMINFLLEQNHVFYPALSSCQCNPASLQSLSDETFKDEIFDLVKCMVDMKLQYQHVGDGNVSSYV